MSSGSSTAVSGTDGPFANLTESQSQAFNKLKALVETNNIYWPQTNNELINAQEINDHTLLYDTPFVNSTCLPLYCHVTDISRRYLRARHYDPQAAYNQYIVTGDWRRNLNIDSYYDSVEISNFEATTRLVGIPSCD